MAKMKSLHGEGVRDLTSYSLGKQDGQSEILDAIRKSVEVNQEALKLLNGLQTIQLLLASFRSEQD